MLDRSVKTEMFDCGQFAPQWIDLRANTEAPVCLVPVSSQRPTENSHIAGARREHLAGEHSESRRLARSVRPEEAEDFAGLDAERHAADGLNARRS